MRHYFTSQYSRNQAYHQFSHNHTRREPLIITRPHCHVDTTAPSETFDPFGDQGAITIPYELYLTRHSLQSGGDDKGHEVAHYPRSQQYQASIPVRMVKPSVEAHSPHEGNNREDRDTFPILVRSCPSPTPQTNPVSGNDDANVKNHQYRIVIKQDKTAETQAQSVYHTIQNNDESVYHTDHFKHEMQKAIWRNWRAR